MSKESHGLKSRDISNLDELIDVISSMKKKIWFSGYKSGDVVKFAGMNFGTGADYGSKYAFTHAHVTLRYQGDMIDVQFLTLMGGLINTFRPTIESLWNDSFVIHEKESDAVKRIAHTYRILNTLDFPTFVPLEENFFPEFRNAHPKILLTKKEKGAHLIDVIRDVQDNAEKLDYLSKASSLMKQLHEKFYIWGDANLTNMMLIDGRLKLYDFGFKPNPNKFSEFLKAKDFLYFCLSGVYRTKLPVKDVVGAVVKGYAPGHNESVMIHLEAERQVISDNSPRFIESVYLKPVFMCDYQKYMEVKREIARQVG